MLKLNRRNFIKNTSLFALSSSFSQAYIMDAIANNPLKIYSVNVAKVTGNWNEMSEKAGVPLIFHSKKGSSKEFLELFSSSGEGQKLYDAISDNGGNQEDLLYKTNSIVSLDTSRIKNWKNLIPEYNEGNVAANTIRNKNGEIVGVPYISNADSMAYNKTKVGGEIDTWNALFDSQFKGYATMQNEPGPTLATTAIYLKETGKQDIDNPSDMSKSEVKGVSQFLIKQKKKGQFKTFWNDFANCVDLLKSEEVLVSSCWEPIAVNAAKKGVDIHYGTMKEGHQTWNNIWMLTESGKRRGQEDKFYKLMDLYLSPWFGARTVSIFGFTPQMTEVYEYVESNQNYFDENEKAIIEKRLKNKAIRMSVRGNSQQNLYPKELLAYYDWWSKVQAA
tara:strand:- start:307 stop:1476 length:1170 start_codon:yes stop_codon:yes gene_type:complete